MKTRDLRELNDEELRQRLRERNEALASFRMQMVTGVVDNVRSARNARRDIAKIKTLIRERELAAAGRLPRRFGAETPSAASKE